MQWGELLSEGWSKLKKNFGIVAQVALIYFALIIVISILGLFTGGETSVSSGIVSLLGNFAGAYLGLGWITISLKIARDEKLVIGDCFQSGKMFLKYVVATFLSGIIILIGIVFLIIPGLYFSFKFCMVPFLIIDKKADILDSMKVSWEMTDGKALFVGGVYLLLFLINIGGLLLFGLGLFITVPLSSIIWAITYNYILTMKETANSIES